MTENTKKDLRHSVAARIRVLMQDRGIRSINAAARDLGINFSTLQSILARDRISRRTAQIIADRWGVEADWVERGWGPMRALATEQTGSMIQSWITDWDLINAGLDPVKEGRKTPKNSLRERLLSVAHDRELKSMTALATAAGIGISELKNILISDAISPDAAGIVANALGISERWLRTGEGPTELLGTELYGHSGFEPGRASEALIPPPLQPDESSAFALIPKAATHLSAGGGIIPNEGQTGERYAFRRDWLSALGVNPKHSILIEIEGDSMEPELRHGDTVLIDLQRTKLKEGRIYAVGIGEVLAIKRLEVAGPDLVRVSSVNPSFSSLTLRADELRILGEAVWSARTLI